MRVVFVTGRLAEPALRRVLSDMSPPFDYDVSVMGINVAALMTTPWIASRVDRSMGQHADLVLVPGLVEGDLQILTDTIGSRVERGPKDLRELPRHFGMTDAAANYGEWDIQILAEINNAPKLTRRAIRETAEYLRGSGADLIDIGCTPGLPFDELGDVVRELAGAGMRVSVDTFDLSEIRAAVSAGAEMVLSVNGSNVDVVRDLAGTGARVVAIPDFGGGLDTLAPTLDALDRWSVPYLIDPILEPVGFGFMASLERYAEVRRRYPGAEMLMGIGNLTELTAADSTGVNALLVAVCQELGVRAVLTTEVASWARGAVREVDIARRLMFHAVTRKTIPKGVDDRLLTVKDSQVLAFTESELRALHARITDSNFRIFADREAITVLNDRQFVRGNDIFDIFAQLDVQSPEHGFYLGKELARASLAVSLGKTYRQEGALSWGYLTPPDDPRREHARHGTSALVPPAIDAND
jgi:dihydropteroate synthase-like protein